MAACILVVDDTQDILDLFHDLLHSEGYEVHTSSVLFEKLSQVEQIAPDLIILDLLIPPDQQAGWSFLQKLKLYPPTSHIPIILCTAVTHLVQDQHEYLLQKGIQVLFKPFELDDLLDRLEQILP